MYSCSILFLYTTLNSKAGEPNFYEISRRFPVPDPPPVYTSYSAYGPPNTGGGPLSPLAYQPHSSPQGYNPYNNQAAMASPHHHHAPPPYGHYPGYPPQHQPAPDSNAYGQYPPQPPQQGAYGHYPYPPPYGMYPPQAQAPAAQEAPPQTQTHGAAAAVEAAEQTGTVEMNGAAAAASSSSSHNQPPSDPNTVSNSNNGGSDDDHYDFDEVDPVEFDEKLYQRVVQIEMGLPVLHTNQNKVGENADQAAIQPPYEAQAPAAFNNFGY